MRKLSLLCLALLAAVAGCSDGPPSSLFNQAGYYVRGDTVYYLDAFPGKAFEIEGADPATFEKLDDQTYAKDRSAVYIDGGVLAGADPATFQLLNEPNYGRDAVHIFLRGRVLTEDPDHFVFVGSGLTKDRVHVFWSDGRVLSDDPDHFEIVSHVDFYLFTRDSATVHVNGTPIAGADPATFTVLGGAYAEDRRALYYFTDRIAGADMRASRSWAGRTPATVHTRTGWARRSPAPTRRRSSCSTRTSSALRMRRTPTTAMSGSPARTLARSRTAAS